MFGLIGFSIGIALLAQRATRELLTAQKESDFWPASFRQPARCGQGQRDHCPRTSRSGGSRIQGELKDQPQLKATLLDNIGNAYERLGHYPEAVS
jgi:hypothetical protein